MWWWLYITAVCVFQNNVQLLVSADEFVFFDAVKSGDLEALNEVISLGTIDFNYADEDGNTPLITASRAGYNEVVSALANAGADLELAAEFPADVDTPLTAASAAGHLGVVKILLEKGALMEGPGRDGRTPLITAAAHGQYEVVKYLVDKGADVNAVKMDGTTSLSWAAYAPSADVVALLVDQGASVDVMDRVDGSQPIHFACQKPGNDTKKVLVRLVEAGADVLARTGVVGPRDHRGVPKENPDRDELQGGRTPLMIAGHEGNVDAIEYLLSLDDVIGVEEVNARDVSGTTALTAAASNNQVEAMKLLYAEGADANVPCADGRAALHHAAYNGKYDAAKWLVKEAKVPVNQPAALTNGAGLGHTPLLVAAYHGHQRIVKLLLRYKANPDQPAKDGATALIAASSAGQMVCVKLLLKAGADPRRRLEGGETAAIVTNDRRISSLLYVAEREAWEKDPQPAGGSASSNSDDGDVDEEIEDEDDLDEEEEEEEDAMMPPHEEL